MSCSLCEVEQCFDIVSFIKISLIMCVNRRHKTKTQRKSNKNAIKVLFILQTATVFARRFYDFISLQMNYLLMKLSVFFHHSSNT